MVGAPSADKIFITVSSRVEQRQIIRILWMPLVFSVMGFFSYRYYRTYTYYELVIIVYEAFVLMAFLALLLAYIGSSDEEQMAVMRSKDKRPLPWPFGVGAARVVCRRGRSS